MGTLKKPYTLLLIVWLLTLNTAVIFSQQAATNIFHSYDSLEKLYKKGAIDDTTFLRKFNKLTIPAYYENPAFPQHLQLYKQVAFSNKKLALFRADYYLILGDIATMGNNPGAGIFYAEKQDEEFRSANLPPTLNGARLQLANYYQWNMYKKGREIAKPLTGTIDSVPRFVSMYNGKIQSAYKRLVFSALNILKYMQIFDYDSNDTLMANKRLQVANEILQAVTAKRKEVTDYGDANIDYYKFIISYMKYEKYKYYKKGVETLSSLQHLLDMATLAKQNNYPWADHNLLILHTVFAQFFLNAHNIDSATAHLYAYREAAGYAPGADLDDLEYMRMLPQIDSMKGDYKSALRNLYKTVNLSDSYSRATLADKNINLYAQAQSEYNREELAKTQKEKKQRNLWIGIISALTLVGFCLYYLSQRQKEQLAQKRITDLTAASQLQIVELEEKNRFAKQEEQQRLGMELHDTLAGSLAAIKIKLDLETMSAHGTGAGERLTELTAMAEAAYQHTRKISHEWFHSTDITAETSFSERINTILDKGLTAGRFEKIVQIDDDCLKSVTLEEKIQLINIIKEAVTNILKYAKANRVSILMYEDLKNIILQIADNGIGFDTHKASKGIGLRTIKERANKIGGQLSIQSSKKGTEISIVMKNKNVG
jgi:signal transduction histidine kinase